MAEQGKRINEATGESIHDPTLVGKIGGNFVKTENPEFHKQRINLYNQILEKQQKIIAEAPKREIEVKLPDGNIVKAKSFETTPLEIAKKISKKLAEDSIVAKVSYSKRDNLLEQGIVSADEDDHEIELSDGKFELWDMSRPLEGDCELQLVNFEDPAGKMTFWHSSAHLLGLALESIYGAHLCFGPPLGTGFFYDSYIGNESVHPEDFIKIDEVAMKIAGEKHKFERIVLTKEEALQMFEFNEFKKMFIKFKIPDGGKTTAYRCGNLIDLCTGPHLGSTSFIKSFKTTKSSSSYWLAKSENDTLQRVYGVSFPSKKLMQEYVKFQEEIAKRDHRNLGTQQSLFFHNPVSAGAAFFYPHGAIVYNKLMDFIRHQYNIRGFKEVITPNMFNVDLWKTSGHYYQYKDNMFMLNISEDEGYYGLKPMNCPAHCVMFNTKLFSYRDLPIRFADFGVLHRNEIHGALSGLTRVRRFQQDDAHIFCRPDQIMDEVNASLDFLDYVYKAFDFDYSLELSTRPDKAIGDVKLWERAENSLKEALEKFGKPWKLNPGDGAFYGPKIDIKVKDALGRDFQCATIQLDFVLPMRFNLQYKGHTYEDHPEEHKDLQVHHKESLQDNVEKMKEEDVDHFVEKPVRNGFERPVIVHRAILGSVERMFAVLCEHTGGKWPFWLSPRQCVIIPVSEKFVEYAEKVSLNIRLV